MSSPHLCSGPSLFAEPLETIRQFRASLAFVSELGDEHRERLSIAGDPQRTGIHWIEADVADQAGGHFLAAPVVSAVQQARAPRLAPRLVDVEEPFARDGPECRHD